MKLIIVEGNPEDRNALMRAGGVETGAGAYAASVLRMFPDAEVHIAYPADRDDCLPEGIALEDADGVIFGGSGLHIYDTDPRVTRQIDFMRKALDAGLPVLGSCWGLQVGVVATGGAVARNPRGREVGVARKVALTEAGAAHPMYTGKSAVFDSPCIHFDEATELPTGATVLASNRHSRIQAVDIPYCKGRFWGVQYHPEFDLAHIAGLYRLYGEDLLVGGFLADEAALETHITELEDVTRSPDRFDLRWRLGIDRDVLDADVRCLEIRNWIESIC